MLSVRRFSGTGESKVKTPEIKRVLLNNTPINKRDAAGFSAWYSREYKKPRLFSLTLSNRKCKRRWGTTWPSRSRIILYRHSVSVFLHELAHITVDDPKEHHGAKFSAELDNIYRAWESWIEGGN